MVTDCGLLLSMSRGCIELRPGGQPWQPHLPLPNLEPAQCPPELQASITLPFVDNCGQAGDMLRFDMHNVDVGAGVNPDSMLYVMHLGTNMPPMLID